MKETREAVEALLEMLRVVLPLIKDGVQLSDAAALAKALSNPQVVAKIKEGIEGAGKIPEEFSTVNLNEVVEIVATVVKSIPSLIASLK